MVDRAVPDARPPDLTAPDPMALRRRVLLTAALTFMLFLAAGYLVTALDVSSAWLLLALALLAVLVVWPLMRPVREATALRRRLAYQAFLEQRATAGNGEDR